MKKLLLILLFVFSSSLFLFALKNEEKKSLSYFENNNNNLRNIINDSISPVCPSEFHQSDNSVIKTKELIINIPDSRGWSKNLISAYRFTSNNIPNRFKKRFNGYIFTKNLNNKLCKIPARIRLSGDWKDHINLNPNGKIISSLDVHLKRGNISGITKFKLFIPDTRNAEAEVIQALILKEMGYLSPRTKLLNVNFNGQNDLMIMQEKATKEMIEHNNLRESAILESDESLLWKLRAKKVGSFNQNIFPKIINKKWIKKNKINQKIAFDGANILSRAILESWNIGGMHKDYTFSDVVLSNNNLKDQGRLSSFRAHLIASGGDHALHNHNRRFYFDPINKSLWPIYYDGMSKLNKLNNLKNYNKYIDERLLLREINDSDIDLAIKEINDINKEKFLINLELSGIEISEKELSITLEKYINNLLFIKNKNKLNFQFQFINNPLTRGEFFGENYGIILSSQNDKFYRCNLINVNCKEINLDKLELNNLLSGKYLFNNLQYYYLGNSFDPINQKYLENDLLNSKVQNLRNNVFFKTYGDPILNIDEDKKIISLEINNIDQKLLILNSKLKNWTIKIDSYLPELDSNHQSRIDSNLLTGLLTIKDSKFNGSKIIINGGNHEDSLNIMNSDGYIELISIKNSYQDSIDFDFSNLKVGKIIVNKSGNDCLDLSAGKYLISDLKISNCMDKGVSTGEGSYVEVSNLSIFDSKIALVSKDSSNLVVKKAILKNNDICISAYNKKQEFGPSKIVIPAEICDKSKYLIQSLSSLEIK